MGVNDGEKMMRISLLFFTRCYGLRSPETGLKTKMSSSCLSDERIQE